MRRVEWKLIEMPLPRLQMMGQSYRPFIYGIYWDQRVEQREVTSYQRSDTSSFDNRVMLRHGVGGYFLQLNGLLRPLIQRRWSAMVASLIGWRSPSWSSSCSAPTEHRPPRSGRGCGKCKDGAVSTAMRESSNR